MISCLKTPLLFCVVLAVVAAQDYTFNFEGCDVDSYYSDLNDDVTSWTRDEVHSLIQGTHRHQLPYTTVGQAGNDDVWAALMDVDEGSVTETVSLIYSSDRVDAIPFGQYTWIKEHVWPVLSLIESEVSLSDTDMIGKDISDIHNIFPASVLSAQVRGTKYFGECGVLSENPNRCRSPAEGGAQDTCACQEVYTPPADKKGDIARALLYMDLRYDGSDRFTQDLRLTDCPFVPLRDMGYLSQMIAWHLEDPPSTEEIQRNDRICQHWQGNRNPLVDHPEIAAALYHEPLDLPVIGERTTYEACDEIPTEPPTRTPDLCDTQVFAGDIYFFMLNSVDPDSIGMYNFRTLPAGLEILMTDNAWNGTAFVNDVPEKDGTVKLAVPENGIPAASAFGYREDGLEYSDDWVAIEGNFSLTTQGEAVFLYCIKADMAQKPLLAFSYGATSIPDDEDTENTYNETSTRFPWSQGEVGFQNMQPHSGNMLFNSTAVPPGVPSEELQRAARDSSYWVADNSSRFTLGGVGGSGGVRIGDKVGLWMTATAALVTVATLWL